MIVLEGMMGVKKVLLIMLLGRMVMHLVLVGVVMLTWEILRVYRLMAL